MHFSKIYFLLSVCATIGSIVGLVSMIILIDPFTASNLVIVLFYIVFFMSVLGVATFIGYGIRRILHSEELVYRQVSTSFRQAIFLSLLMVIILILQKNHYLTWWLTALLIICFAFIEYYVASYSAHVLSSRSSEYKY
jgi:hypothetical protein